MISASRSPLECAHALVVDAHTARRHVLTGLLTPLLASVTATPNVMEARAISALTRFDLVVLGEDEDGGRLSWEGRSTSPKDRTALRTLSQQLETVFVRLDVGSQNLARPPQRSAHAGLIRPQTLLAALEAAFKTLRGGPATDDNTVELTPP